jgi:butyryl-CoA dehydrogenase
MIESAHTDRAAAAAGAAPYLALFGTVLGGYMMAQAALIAQRRLQDGSDEAAFYTAKLHTARFYAEVVLAGAGALEQAARAGADAVVAFDPANF